MFNVDYQSVISIARTHPLIWKKCQAQSNLMWLSEPEIIDVIRDIMKEYNGRLVVKKSKCRLLFPSESYYTAFCLKWG